MYHAAGMANLAPPVAECPQLPPSPPTLGNCRGCPGIAPRLKSGYPAAMGCDDELNAYCLSIAWQYCLSPQPHAARPRPGLVPARPDR